MIFSVLVLTCIALLPVLSDPEERRVWFTRLCLCRGWRARGQDEPEGCVSLKRSLCVDATHTYGTRLHTYVLVPSTHSLTHHAATPGRVRCTYPGVRTLITFYRLYKRKRFANLSSRTVWRLIPWYAYLPTYLHDYMIT